MRAYRRASCVLMTMALMGVALLATPARATVTTACNDGIDNDLDGYVDYPADLGCSSSTDNSEVDPYRVGAYQMPHYASGIDISYPYAYVVASDFGLAVFNVLDPANPALVGEETQIVGNDVQVVGNYAYVVSEDTSTLYVVDISTPTSPKLVGSAAITNVESPNSVFVSGSLAYVGAYQYQNLEIFDVSDPAHPSLEGQLIDSRVACADIFVEGSYAYCAYGDIDVIDVSNPALPSYVTNTGVTGENLYALTSDGTTLYGSGCYLMGTFDLTDPASPSLVGQYDTGSDCGRRVLVDSGYAYIAQQQDGLRILNVADRANPSNVAALAFNDSYGDPYNALDVAKYGNYAYVANDSGGLKIVDVSTPATPSLTGSFSDDSYDLDVFKVGTLAYVAAGDAGLEIFDVSDPSAPTVAGTYPTGGYARAVWVVGDYAYVADYDVGLLVVNVATPASPTLEGSKTLAGSPVALQVIGDHAYVAEGDYGYASLETLNVSDPAHPAHDGQYDFDTGFTAGGLVVQSSTAYVSLGYSSNNHRPAAVDGDNALGVIDVTDPAQPSLVTVYTFLTGGGGISHGLDVVGNHAYIAADDGLFIVDVTTPATPSNSGSYPGSYLYDVKVVGGIAYVASDDHLNEVVNVADPAAPYLVGQYPGPQRYGRRLVVDGGLAYIAAAESGLQVVGYEETQIFADGFESGDTTHWTTTVQ